MDRDKFLDHIDSDHYDIGLAKEFAETCQEIGGELSLGPNSEYLCSPSGGFTHQESGGRGPKPNEVIFGIDPNTNTGFVVSGGEEGGDTWVDGHPREESEFLFEDVESVSTKGNGRIIFN